MTRLEDPKPGAMVRGTSHGEPVDVFGSKLNSLNIIRFALPR